MKTKKVNALKTLIWKIRCAYWMHRILYLSWRHSWGYAGSVLESFRGDITECTPRQAAEEELDAWQCSQ